MLALDSHGLIDSNSHCRDMPAYALKRRQDVEIDTPDLAPVWKLPEPAPLRTKAPLIQMEAVSFAYPESIPAQPQAASTKKTQAKETLSNITICLEQVLRWHMTVSINAINSILCGTRQT